MLVRKERAGADSRGHVWNHDGAVVEVPDDQAGELVAIPDGGFSLAEPDTAGEPADDPAPAKNDDGDSAEREVDEAPRPARRGRPRNTTHDKDTVEE